MCLFCDIAAGKIPSKRAYEDDSVVAFYDIAPQAPVHILVIPRKHIECAQSLTEADNELLGHMFAVSRKIAAENGLDKTGYRLITNNGPDGLQSVPHLHLHLIGGRKLKWDN